MNILFLCHRFPYPPNRGGKIRPFNMIRHLSRDHAVTVGTLAHSREELNAGHNLQDHCEEVIAEVLPSSVRWAQALQALPTSTSSSVAYFYSSRLRQRLLEVWQRKRFDAVWVHCAFAAQYVSPLRGAFRVLDYGDLDSFKWAEYAQRRAWPLAWGYALESRKLQRFEQEIAGHFQRITVTTAGELEAFNRLGIDLPCRVIVNGVDLEYFRPPVSRPTATQVIAFLGRMDYFPNIDAVIYFARQVLPEIQRVLPQVEFRIIGSNPSKRVRSLAAQPGITVTGFVKDVRPFLQDVAVGVVPVRIGRGTQNKMLESMAMGIPTVASTTAAKGVQATPGKHFLMAATAPEFARHVIELLRDPDLRAQLAAAGRLQLEGTHNWPVSLQNMDAVLAEARAKEHRHSTV
jgi:sugar transferase (PEP-CTERM/EpsH1 system associated)